MSTPDETEPTPDPPAFCLHCEHTEFLTYAGCAQAGDPPVWIDHWNCTHCQRPSYTIAGLTRRLQLAREQQPLFNLTPHPTCH